MSNLFVSSPPTILFVDNDEKHLSLYQTELNARGYQVICMQQGHQALEQIRSRKFDLAVVNTTLADIDGLDLVDSMATSCSRMPIIIHTDAPFYANNFRSWAADAVVTKSKATADLLNKITSFLERN
jgi:DNA-binding response OmpR family regulator